MKRDIEQELLAWKNRPERKPLLIRGARQIGKTYSVDQFGKKYFDSILTVNFEEMKDVKKTFEGDLTISLILRDLSVRFKQPIIPGQTLLFFDEIQACPEALLSLRFFKEQLPELHVIGAGSLLEFIMGDDRFSFPVGRIEYLYMRPLSFREFLIAKGELEALAWIKEATVHRPVGITTHHHLLKIAKEYFMVGGMPECVSSFIQTSQFLSLDMLHKQIISTYENDLGKYPRSSQQKFLKLLFEAAPRLVGENFKYAKIHPYAQSRDYIEALDVLTRTGILHRVFANSASGIPLAMQKIDKKFKLLFLDIGLLPQAEDPVLLDAEDIAQVHKGMLAEQFVGQELIAYSPAYKNPALYYWERDKQGSAAEVDYLIEVGPEVVPIEVKAGARGRLRSIKQFLTEKKFSLGIQISQAPLSLDSNILSIPLYMISELGRLVRDCTSE
ncbi:MAG: ATP-binding protein [Rhabdochlamydiaceae bacterium]|jgi:predicted AAA+ superfamily ATPase